MMQVASVLHRMESVNSFLHNNIHTALKKHYMAICVTEARRKEEIAIMSQQQQHREYLEDYKGSSLKLYFLFPLSALCNLPLLCRHPAHGHGIERPRCLYEDTPHCPVVRSSVRTSQSCQEPGSGHGNGQEPLTLRGRFI